MPVCFRGKDQTGQDKVPDAVPPHQDWREPPGYLGEAVRRAKRISKPEQNGAAPPGTIEKEN